MKEISSDIPLILSAISLIIVEELNHTRFLIAERVPYGLSAS